MGNYFSQEGDDDKPKTRTIDLSTKHDQPPLFNDHFKEFQDKLLL